MRILRSALLRSAAAVRHLCPTSVFAHRVNTAYWTETIESGEEALETVRQLTASRSRKHSSVTASHPETA